MSFLPFLNFTRFYQYILRRPPANPEAATLSLVTEQNAPNRVSISLGIHFKNTCIYIILSQVLAKSILSIQWSKNIYLGNVHSIQYEHLVDSITVYYVVKRLKSFIKLRGHWPLKD